MAPWHCRRRRARALLGLLLVSILVHGTEQAQAQSEAAAVDEPVAEDAPRRAVQIRGRVPTTASSEMVIPPQEFELRPFESGGQLLEVVPGLITAQHTGGGKAEQYFLRGFDADHGTDLAVFFDGVPANLRSHAHGQGFLDLHFVIPELVEVIHAEKGPYRARYGDFYTSAAVEYQPLRRVDESFVHAEYGEFDTARGVALVSPGWSGSGGIDALLATEAYYTNGPFDDDEDLSRFTLYGSLGGELAPGWTLSGHVLGYWADWNASGLIPEALVDDDTLGFFDSLDPTEGGDSTRIQAKLRLAWEPSPLDTLSLEVWTAYYQLDLYSNFTYFLNFDDPAVGDGIVQRDDRVYGGASLEYLRELETAIPVVLGGGVQLRHDHASVKLGNQTRRNFRFYTNDDEIDQTSVAPWLEADADPLPWVRVLAGLRYEVFRFEVEDDTGANPSRTDYDAVWLPKASLSAAPFSDAGPAPVELDAFRSLRLFANFGEGFHSNDARDVAANPSQTSLPVALGWEVGLQSEPLPGLELALGYWWLSLESEFVFVGDEGTTEANPRTVRRGLEGSLRWRLWQWLSLRGDVAYSRAEFNASGDPVPQSPRFVASGALRFDHPLGLSAELSVKHLGERYATEDDFSQRLEDYTILSLGVRLRRGPFEVGAAIENLTDEKWRSSEFFYESRPIAGGPASEDFHFTAGNPRNVRAWVRAYF